MPSDRTRLFLLDAPLRAQILDTRVEWNCLIYPIVMKVFLSSTYTIYFINSYDITLFEDSLDAKQYKNWKDQTIVTKEKQFPS